MASLQVRRANKARTAMSRAKREEERMRRVAIIRQHAGIISSRQIAAIMGCTPDSVRALACEFSISLVVPRNAKLTEEDYSLISHLEADGMDDEIIMAKFECSMAELRRARNKYRTPATLSS